MKAFSQQTGGVFDTVVAAVAMIAPMALVVAAAAFPAGSRGALMVEGLEALVASLVAVLTLRAMYVLGFARAAQAAESSTPPPRRSRHVPRDTTPRTAAAGTRTIPIGLLRMRGSQRLM